MIPPDAKKVFEGVIFDVYQWEQEMFDGTIATFEMTDRQDTAEVIATVGGKIILQEQEQPHEGPFYSLPGGRIERGEDPLEGAKRELLEESGHESDDWELIREAHPYSKMRWAIFLYVARECRKTAGMQLDAGEKIVNKLITLGELLDLADSGERFWIESALRTELVRAKYHPPSREALDTRLFGTS